MDNVQEIKCYSCDEVKTEKSEFVTSANGEQYCRMCYDDNFFLCNNCGDETHIDQQYSDDRENSICETCYNDDYFRCDGCDNVYNNDNYSGDGYCYECAPSEDDSEDRPTLKVNLHRYTDITKKSATTKQLTIGAEIEAENGNYSGTFEAVKALDVGAGITTDGSLNDSGIEVITAPSKYSTFQENIKKITKKMREQGYQATKSTGLHIHIGLNGTTDEQLVNIIKTFVAVEDTLYTLIAPSRRDNTYCKPITKIFKREKIRDKSDLIYFLQHYYSKGGNMDVRTYKERKINLKEYYKGEKYNSARYYGLNLHSFIFRNTLEFRYHNGTLNAEKINNWSKLLLSIVNYARLNYNQASIDYLASLSSTPKTKLNALLRTIKATKKLRQYLTGRHNLFATA